MKKSEKMFGRREVGPPIAARDRTRLELQVLVLQSSIAAFFVAGALTGLFGAHGHSALAAASWIAGYHIVRGWYVIRFRIGGRPLPLAEAAIPLLDVSCITMAWLVLNETVSPFWAVYLYALAGYARRYAGARYYVLAGFVVANLIAGHMVIAGQTDASIIDANLVTMVVLALAMAALSQAVAGGWRAAERQSRILAETDPLTGIANRRIFLESLDLLARIPNQRFAVLMLDLDDFKRLNDEFGHLHGDDVLERVATVLSENVRDGDYVARYGGEEFVVGMPDTNLTEATFIAERLRQAIRDLTPTTVSIGCAASEPGETSAAVLHRADEMLLTAKRTGKNVVRTAPLKRSA